MPSVKGAFCMLPPMTSRRSVSSLLEKIMEEIQGTNSDSNYSKYDINMMKLKGGYGGYTKKKNHLLQMC